MNVRLEALLDRAAELPSGEWERFLAQECPDPQLREEVAAQLRYAEEAENCFDRVVQGTAASLETRHEPSTGDVIGSYRILSLIGRGGMGSVYLAERADGEVQQRVALKILRDDGYRPEWRERFLRERQLLASLHHPSVVRLFDAGHTLDGRPFLVMEHVEGVAIDRYAFDIAVRDRLKLFLRVCEGVSHAHRSLIIHRDLKPSNILVDNAGQPKLLDFGIAKLQDENAEMTQTAEQLLTPNYASPEQLRGDAQTTATDIYSLGAVLYKLVTGKAPRENGTVPSKRSFEPASALNPESPRDLDYVIGKALRPEAENRYGSVDDFADDVRAVLEQRPVEARSGERWYRIRRRLRKHWLPAAASVLVTASLVTGLWIAESQRRIAERRFADVRQLANKLFDIDAQVAQLPGASKTRQLIVDTALQYLTRVSADARRDPALALELATAYMRVGRVQGVNISPNLGQTEQARKSEEQAQALLDLALTANPHNRMALLRGAQIAHDRMILAGDMRREEEALRFAHTALERVDQYIRSEPLNAFSDHADAQQAIITLINVANRFSKSGDSDEAIRVGASAADIATGTGWSAQAGAALMVVAMARRQKGELDEAVAAIRESIRLLQPTEGEQRTGRIQPYGLALIREAQLLGEPRSISLNRPGEAIWDLERALDLGRRFASQDPSDFQSQYRIFFAETKLADMIRDREPVRALSYYDDGLRKLAAMTGNGGTLRNEAVTLAASVYPLLRLGKRREARRRLDIAFDRLKKLREYPADKVSLQSPAIDALRALAEYEASAGDIRRASAVYTELVRLLDADQRKVEDSLEAAVQLSNIYDDSARLARRGGMPAKASELEARRFSIWQRWYSVAPGNRFIRQQFEAARPRVAPKN